MDPILNTTLVTVLLLISACSSCALGFVVLTRNPQRPTHRVFFLMTINLTLWALGVLSIVHCHTESSASYALMITFVIAGFLPATYYQFLCLFPVQRFEGSRILLGLFYLGAISIAGLATTPYYLDEISVYPDAPPQVIYGPAFNYFSLLILIALISGYMNLIRKRKQVVGIERRQIDHVIFGTFISTGLATLTNIIAPALDFGSVEVLGPCFVLILIATLAYSMIRYHLLDIMVLISRTTVYMAVTVSVVLIYTGTVSLINFVLKTQDNSLFSTIVAALVVVLALQPIKERFQLVVDRTVLFRHYDARKLIGRITRVVSHSMQLDILLESVAKDLQATVGVNKVQLRMIAEKNLGMLVTEYSTEESDIGQSSNNMDMLIQYVEQHNEPISLQELIHQRPTAKTAQIAAHLAAINAYLLVPLKTTSGLIGMMTLGEKSSKDIYTQDDIRVFSLIAGPIAAAIENAQLYRKLEELNLHLERVMTHMRAGVISINHDGLITTINQEAQELLGTLQVGDSCNDLDYAVSDLLKKTLEKQRGISDVETVLTGHEGELIPVALSSSCFAMADTEMLGAMVLIFNMTQIKRLESTVKRADRLTSIGTMAAGMAHEIKNPLVSIKTFTQLLLERYDDDDFRKTFAEVVPPEVQRIDTIVTRLLDFARPKPVSFETIDLEKIIMEVMALVENQTKKADITVQFDRAENGEMITGDEQQLHQVFLNMMLNAIDALIDAEDRRLSIRLDYGHAHLKRDGKRTEFNVPCAKVMLSDTGCGIESDHIDQLFTPFFTTKAYGSGLGLSVVHGIVTEHGGEVDVTSAKGVGTTFFLTFPLSKEPAATERLQS